MLWQGEQRMTNNSVVQFQIYFSCIFISKYQFYNSPYCFDFYFITSGTSWDTLMSWQHGWNFRRTVIGSRCDNITRNSWSCEIISLRWVSCVVFSGLNYIMNQSFLIVCCRIVRFPLLAMISSWLVVFIPNFVPMTIMNHL